MDGLAGLRVFESARARRRFVVHVLVAGGLLAVLAVAFRRELGFLFDAQRARAFVDGFGGWAPAVFVVLQAAQVVAAPVPGQVLAAVAGYLFGPWWGTLYNMVGITLGSAVAFWLARRFGRAYVERTVHPDALARFDGIDDRHAQLSLFVLFLVPGLPDDVICFAGGLTTVPLRRLVLIAIVGRAPGFFLVNVFGGLLGSGERGWATVLLVALLVGSALGFWYRERLLDRLTGGR
ncbi:MAG: TVP38/TMEM64 family protein [Halobacteriales archaeon]